MIFLTRLRPSSVDPELLVNRTKEVRWLQQRISAYLADRTPDAGAVVCVLGAKGVGKSIVTRQVIRKLQRQLAATTMFVTVDCRRKLTQRKVLRLVADGLHQALGQMQRNGLLTISNEIVANAGVVKTLAGYTEVTLSSLHEDLVVFKEASKLALGGKLLDFLSSEFNIAVSRGQKERQAIEGTIKFDDDALREAIVKLLQDIRAQDKDVDVVIYLDNIDELDHDACYDDAKREYIRKETLGLLDLCRAPAGLVLNMRTYYASTLLREVNDILNLGSLHPEDMSTMLNRRLEEETEANRTALASESWTATIASLCKMATTPFVFLRWFKYLTEWDEHPNATLTERLSGYSTNYFANISTDVLSRVAAVFAAPGATVGRHRILEEACDGREAVLSQLIHAQAILPRDFWEPNEFTLDPELHYMIPNIGKG